MIDPRQPDLAKTLASRIHSGFAYRPADPTLPPLVSVVTPFYNESDAERFEETARCVLGQSLQRFEWIIVNDGSDCPSALALLERFRNGRRDPRVRVIDHETSLGLSGARNTGEREASTEFVFQIESGDLIEPTTIEKRLWTLTFRPEEHPQWAHQPRETPWSNPLAKEKRRLLLVLPWLRMGGADKFNRDLLDQMTRRGWEVTVATTNVAPHPWLSEFSSITPDVFLLDQLAQPLQHATILRGLIESRRPDVVLMSNSAFGYAVLPALRSLCPEPAYIDYCHMEEEGWWLGGYPRRSVSAQPFLELSVTASRHLKNWMVERGSDPSKVAVATINVDPEAWKPDAAANAGVRERIGIDPGTTVILYAGRICPQKQPMVFAETMRRLKAEAAKKGERFVALVAGSGEDEEALTERLARDGLLERGAPGGEVRLLGECSIDEMRGLMAAADIFFVPSEWEGIAMVAYEAMACETVFVGADVGGQSELLTPYCGELLSKAEPGRAFEDEPPAYASVLLDLICDPKKRVAMGRAARERICKHYTLDAMGERMDSLLKRAIELKRREPRPTLPPPAAIDLLERAIETDRLQRSIDHLWREHQRVKGRNAELRGKLQETQGRAYRMERRLGRLAPSPARQLEAIEASRAWRMVRKLKGNPVYAGYARLRYGSSWKDQLDKGSPAQRLARIHNSKAYRLLSALKALRGLPPVGGPMGDMGGSGREPAPRKLVEKESRVELNGAVSQRPLPEPQQTPAKPAQEERSAPPVVVRQKDMASGRSR